MASSELHSRNTETGVGQVICPKCGEVNSSNFLFCGMCGTILEPARRATAAGPVPVARAAENQIPANSPVNRLEYQDIIHPARIRDIPDR
jgi:hypothetical protein